MRHHRHLMRHITDWMNKVELFFRPQDWDQYPSGDVTVDNTMRHLLCTGDITVTLQASAERTSVLTVTNIGTGVVTITAQAGEVIEDELTLTLDFQWTTVQLLPKTGGYVII